MTKAEITPGDLTPAQRAHLAKLAKRDNGRVYISCGHSLTTRPKDVLDGRAKRYTEDYAPDVAQFLKKTAWKLEADPTVAAIRKEAPGAAKRAKVKVLALFAEIAARERTTHSEYPVRAGLTFLRGFLTASGPMFLAGDTLQDICDVVAGTDDESERLYDSISVYWDCAALITLPLEVYDLNKPLRAIN